MHNKLKDKILTKTPWSWGRIHDFCAFFRRSEGSNLAANFFCEGEKQERETRIWRRTKKRHARERPLTRKRARNRGLDPKLEIEQETGFEGCGMRIERPLTHET